jgi:presenilin 1
MQLKAPSLKLSFLCTPQTSFAMAYDEKATDTVQQKAEGSLLNAAYFIGMVVAVTVILLLLYKFHCMKIIYGYLIFSVFSLLVFTGGVLLGNLVLRFGITIDWPTFVFFLTNFGALGSFAVFFTAPSIVKQGYLVCVSVIMAWSLSKLPDWSNWSILIALAVYDLFAVLSPCGPLKALVEMSQSRNEPIPGLVYEADAPDNQNAAADSPPLQTARSEEMIEVEARDCVEMNSDSGPRLRGRVAGISSDTHSAGIEMAALESADADSSQRAGAIASSQAPAGTQTIAADHVVNSEDGEQDGGIKLGLGDFVFYSVLVARYFSHVRVCTAGEYV